MPRSWNVLFAVACTTLLLAVVLHGQAPPAATPQTGPAPMAAPGGGRGQVELPEGTGKDLVNGLCVGCHPTNMITGSTGYTQAGWKTLIGTMVQLPDTHVNTITTYLATAFPPKPGREPKLVAGHVNVTFREWQVPTLGQRARDPLMTPDGMIWWNGQFISVVGRLNPQTGEMKEFAIDPSSRPHSITNDSAGNIWYTGNGNGTIGKLVPSTGDVTVYKMPDPAARDPHTAIFNREGTMFFTVQQSNMIGRLVPSTGEITLIKLAVPRSLPYGIKEDSKGTIWVSCNGTNRLISVDPKTMEWREHVQPDPGTRSRRLAIASDDTIWFVNSAQGRIGRYVPSTGQFKEWPSPSGPDSHPYAIEIIDDVVWYNESNQRPDALVRFDPKTEAFQSWAIPSGVGIIRHMRKTPDGNLAIHQSSTARIGLALISKPAGTNTRR